MRVAARLTQSGLKYTAAGPGLARLTCGWHVPAQAAGIRPEYCAQIAEENHPFQQKISERKGFYNICVPI